MCALEIQTNIVGTIYTKLELKFEGEDPMLAAFLAK